MIKTIGKQLSGSLSRSSSRRLFLSLGLVILTLEPASSGTLSETPGFAECDFLFSGEVARGDADEIERVIPELYEGSRLCLNSPGGDFAEGLRMFQVIWDKDSLATRVRSGDSCLSACAIAFLGGSLVQGTGLIRANHAVIEPGARLGFHAPSLSLPEGGSYNAATVGQAYALALTSSAELFELTQQVETGAWGMTEFLFYQTIRTPPEAMYDIDTIGKATLSGVAVANIPTPELTWRGIRHVCDTAVAMTGDGGENVSSVDISFSPFSDVGEDGSGNPIELEDRTWSWGDEFYIYFAVRGYRAPHVSEKFCMATLSCLAYNREMRLPLSERDPTLQSFHITLWEDAHIPVDGSFAQYVEANTKSETQVAVPWIALWDPMTPLDDFGIPN